MLDPFTFYTRLVSAAFGMASTVQRAGDTLTASKDVIAKRSAMIGAAIQSPVDGNYTELGKMLPEKIDAFSKAGTAMANDWWAMQSDVMREVQHMSTMAMRGRAPTMMELSALGARNTAFALRAFERAGAMGGKGLKPIHTRAMANAKRLKRTGA